MKFLFKLLTLGLIFLLNLGCTLEEQRLTGVSGLTQVYIDRLQSENPGSSVDFSIEEKTFSHGNPIPYGFLIELEVKDSLVLTNTMDSLRVHGVYVSNAPDVGYKDLPFHGLVVSNPDTLDTIIIKTDSVIIFDSLILRNNNIRYLPASIGNLRLRTLNIELNPIDTLPIEIMNLDSVPIIFDTVSVRFNRIWTNDEFNALPQWTQDWLWKHNVRKGIL